MATTATISSSTTLPVVGRSTMNLVGASTPPTTPPATPTSPILGASDPAKTYGEADSMSKSTALLDSSAKVQQATMEATPPPSPPPAPISSTLLPMTPFPMDLDSEALPLTATITTTAKLDSSAGHSLSSTVAALASAAALASGSGPVSGPVSIITPAATTAAAATTTTTTTLASTVTAASQASAPIPSGEATTFFDDVINAPKPPANILTLSPTTSLPDVYHDFFDNHPELYYDSDQSSSEDPEMMEDMMMQSLLDDPEGLSPATAAVMRARTMTDLRHTTGTAICLFTGDLDHSPVATLSAFLGEEFFDDGSGEVWWVGLVRREREREREGDEFLVLVGGLFFVAPDPRLTSRSSWSLVDRDV
ncbi:hypothetical protein EDD11_002760 [Mortierella claussenii]|nr:hypothetical protein EDD11_002760 [Mortierella claussenii]